ncbi:leucyl/phenylalanyl-tRNA--protein transferase [Burkholderiaceae bacterium DAT-1]|nr:leucyl/phenylalanyl-tRNA--protein transferase [Burkholderiaceae bacterium DAT-1]
MIPWLNADCHFPPVTSALLDPNGLLAAGGTLSTANLIKAYRQGIFPWFSPGDPFLWWCPDPRTVLFPANLHVPRSLAKVIRNKPYEVRFDTAFSDVMRGCAGTPRPGQDGTWITSEIISAYTRLHDAGVAHSAECWMDGKLVGGLYGVAIGRMFYGESMFAHVPDASKIAFVHLVRWLDRHGFGMIDCQMHTEHLARFGSVQIARPAFIDTLTRLCDQPGLPGPWQYAVSGEPEGGNALESSE